VRVEETKPRKNLLDLRDPFLRRVDKREDAQAAIHQPTILVAVGEVAARLLDGGLERHSYELRSRLDPSFVSNRCTDVLREQAQ
jgi:hypothetical protein